MPSMKFETPRCPECGQLAHGTLEKIEGVAQLIFEDEEGEDGRADYAGETEVDWNSQETKKDPEGRVLMECPEAHSWYSVMIEYPDEEPAGAGSGQH